MDFASLLLRVLISLALSAIAAMFRSNSAADAEPAEFEKLAVAEEGRGTPWVGGTVWLNMNVVWSGDRTTQPIKR